MCGYNALRHFEYFRMNMLMGEFLNQGEKGAKFLSTVAVDNQSG